MLTVLPQNEKFLPLSGKVAQGGTVHLIGRASTWHTQTVTAEALASLLARIKAVGGTVAHSRPGRVECR